MRAAVLAFAFGPGLVAVAQAPLVPEQFKGWLEVGGVIASVATSLAGSKYMSAQALKENEAQRVEIRELREELARMRVQAAGMELKAAEAQRQSEEAHRVGLAYHKRMDERERDEKADSVRRAEWEGQMSGKVEAFHARAEDIAKNVHQVRNEVGLQVGRLEERLDNITQGLRRG